MSQTMDNRVKFLEMGEEIITKRINELVLRVDALEEKLDTKIFNVNGEEKEEC